MVAELTSVGVPLMEQFVVLNVSPVFKVKFGEILQDVTVPVTVTALDEIPTFCVKTKGDPE